MCSDGEPIDPSPTIDRAISGGFPWLEIQCSRCKTPSDVDLAALKHPPTTFVHDLASRLRRRKCAKTGRRPSATLLLACVATAPPPSRGLESLRSQQESSTVIYSDHGWTPKMKTATAYLETLNPEQRRAVEHGAADGLAAPPLLVIAGAGSGRPTLSPIGSPI
jgi:hypothetical protein